MLTLGQYNYWVVIVLMMSGFYIVISRGNLIKQVVGLSIFQTSVFILYISLAYVTGATAPITHGDEGEIYANPLPHVLILTAIVVNVSTTAVALALVVRINETYGTIEQDELGDLLSDMDPGRDSEQDGSINTGSNRARTGDRPA
jgi:multicomponent Na+:H+ antiporter subunit C